MKENGIYFGKSDYYNIIKQLGGSWNDTKERPIVCLIKIDENDDIYWAIPIGNWNHRNEIAKKRITSYINLPDSNIASCYYHLGRTTTKSIFFISDVIPITEKYIEREYLGYDSQLYVIKNPNYFRQHITNIKRYLIEELEKSNSNEPKEYLQFFEVIDIYREK